MLGSGLPPVLLQVSGQSPLAALLRPGQSTTTLVQQKDGALFLQLAGKQVPLQADAGLVAGQAVTVRAETTAAGLQLFVQPQATGTAGQSPASPLANMIANVFKALGAERLGSAGTRLLPPGMPITQARVEQLLTLFARPGSTGQDLNSVLQLLNGAVSAGAFSADRAAELARWLNPQGFGDAKELHERLLRFARQRAPEARLAALLADGLSEDGLLEFRALLRQQLLELLDNDLLMAHLRSRGEAKGFKQSLGRVLDAWQTGDLQNLHAQEQSYVFLEIPAGGEIDYARLHLFGERGGQRGRSDAQLSAVLDISLSQLGALWIRLGLHGKTCQCEIRATDATAVAAIRGESAELCDTLEVLGYVGVCIFVNEWDGDSLRETATMMQGLGPLDVQA